MGLLDYLTSHSMDEDYAHVHAQHQERSDGGGGDAGEGPPAEPDRRRSALTSILVLAAFGLLVVTAGVQASRDAANAESTRAELVSQIEARRVAVDRQRARIDDAQQETQRLETALLEATEEGRALSSQLELLSTTTGAGPVTGPGVRVVVDDAPGATEPEQQVLDRDLQKLVNALWASGAEAISINDLRLTNLSAIRVGGRAITVNYRSLTRPYTVLAVGDPDTMPARFVDTTHGSDWLDLQRTVGLQFSMTTEESLTLPASSRTTLRHATVPQRNAE